MKKMMGIKIWRYQNVWPTPIPPIPEIAYRLADTDTNTFSNFTEIFYKKKICIIMILYTMHIYHGMRNTK